MPKDRRPAEVRDRFQEFSIRGSAHGLRAVSVGPLVIDVGQVVKEAVAATEVLGDLRGELLVQGVGGLLGGRYLEGRGVHDHPEPHEPPKGLGEHLDGSVHLTVRALSPLPLGIDGEGEPFELREDLGAVAGAVEVLPDGLLDEVAFGETLAGAILGQALSNLQSQPGVDAHALRLVRRPWG